MIISVVLRMRSSIFVASECSGMVVIMLSLQTFGIDQWGKLWDEAPTSGISELCIMDVIIWPRPMSSDPIDDMQSSDPETKSLRWLGPYKT
jgi:hypothetical protein